MKIMNVKVFNVEGKVAILSVNNKTSIEDVKLAAVCRLLKPSLQEEHKLFRLISVRHSSPLEEKVLAYSTFLRNGDELILAKVKDRSSGDEENESSHSEGETSAEDSVDEVNLELVQHATAHLTPKARVPPSDMRMELRSLAELQPVFVTLVSYAQKLLCLSKDAERIFTHVQQQLSNPQMQVAAHADESSVSQLVDMGFPRPRASKALRLNHNVLSTAMDWLFANEGDPHVDEPLDSWLARRSTQGGDAEVKASQQPQDGFVQPMSASQVLKMFRAYNRSQFQPNENAKHQLMEMGFDEAAVMDALRMAGNEQGGALDLLLNPRHFPDEEDELLTGVSEDSPLWKAICADSVVQLALTNPNTLFVLLDILDNPASAMRWMNNPEVGAFLYQISRIYNSEAATGESISSSPPSRSSPAF